MVYWIAPFWMTWTTRFSRSLKMAPFESIDHIGLSISLPLYHCKYSSILYRFWVIWRWIISWLWNLVYRSLKVFQTGTIRKSGYSFFFSFYTVTVALSCIISKIKWDVDRKSRFFHTPPGKYYTVTLKSRLEVTQGHWKWYHLKALVRFPIHIP